MEWGQVLSVIAANFGMFLWLRSEANADRREAAADRRDILQLINAIKEEIKDFHGRLCEIESEKKRKS